MPILQFLVGPVGRWLVGLAIVVASIGGAYLEGHHKGYVERVFGSDFSFQEVRDPKAHSKLKAKHLLSFTSSGNSQIWLEEQGQWQSLIDVFDHYLERAFCMASSDHVHFPSVTAGLSERFFLQHMEEVRQAALKACKSIAQPGPE